MAKTLKEVLVENEIELTEGSGERYLARCPFHKGDNEPSFTVYSTGTYYCWGCEAWGDSIKFLVEYKGWTTKQALEHVGEDYKFPKADKAQVIKIKNVSVSWKFIYDCNETYHRFLIQNPGAINYLRNRGLKDSTISKYKLGYTDGHILNLVYSWERELAVEVGMMNKSGYEALSHRIIIPNLLATEKNCDFIIGRTVVNDNIKYLGLRAPKPFFGFHELRHSPILFVVEGQIDWLLLRQWGYPAISMSGHHVPSYFYSLLANKYLVIVPDYDENGVGQGAAQALLEMFKDRAIILDYSRYKKPGQNLDIGELALDDDGEQKFFEVVQENIWTLPISINTLTRSLPNLISTESALLI